jgi:hypothetical protein
VGDPGLDAAPRAWATERFSSSAEQPALVAPMHQLAQWMHS